MSLDERIQLLLDGRLDADEAAALEREIAADPEARRVLESMRWLKQATRDALQGAPAPPSLESRIRTSLAPRRRILPLLAAAAALIVLVGSIALWVRDPGLVVAAAEDLEAFRHGELQLALETGDVDALESWFVAQGIDFETRVFDLAMMDYHLVGGIAHELSDRPSAAFAYRRGDGLLVLCQMFRATIDELPQGADVRENDGIRFYSYRRGCVAMTFWREGDVLCVLSSMGELDEVIQLAFAKAVKV